MTEPLEISREEKSTVFSNFATHLLDNNHCFNQFINFKIFKYLEIQKPFKNIPLQTHNFHCVLSKIT